MPHSEELQRLVDDEDVEGLFAVVSVEEIADAWWRYQLRDQALDDEVVDHADWWAVELWFGRSVYESTDRGRELIHALAERGPEGADLGILGAGPVEGYIASDESSLLWIEAESRRSENYRKALATVWIDSWATEEVFLRIEAAAGVRLAWPESRGPRPGTRELSRATPEEAAVAWFFSHQTQATPIGSRINGDEARVWLLTRDVPSYYLSFGEGSPPQRWDDATQRLTSDSVPFEEYEALCVYEGGLWRRVDGRSGFSKQTPNEISERAEGIKANAA